MWKKNSNFVHKIVLLLPIKFILSYLYCTQESQPKETSTQKAGHVLIYFSVDTESATKSGGSYLKIKFGPMGPHGAPYILIGYPIR